MRDALRLAAALVLWAGSAAAQVGHDPARSPYRDVPRGSALTVSGGWLNGDGGAAGVGPHQGPVVGLLYEARVSKPLALAFGARYAAAERMIVNPSETLANRFSGPVDQGVLFLEGGFVLHLTGGKTWHRLAPYVGAGLGVAIGESTPQDSTAYAFGTRFFLAPNAGVKLYLADRLHLRVEARSIFWQLKYPTSYAIPPAAEPGAPPVIIGTLAEWTATGMYLVGLGYAISF